MSGKKVAIIATSADKMGDHTTGAWSEEITGPFYVFQDKGFDVEIFSVNGGKVPIDAGSLSDNFKTENDTKFEKDGNLTKFENTRSLKDIDIDSLACLFFAGGHGTVVDFPDNCGEVVTSAYAKGKVVAAVCHGPTALYKAKDGEDPLVKGKKVCGFSNDEESAVGLTDKVPLTPSGKPCTPEQMLRELGGEYVPGDSWSSTAVRDGRLVTGQNPQSSVKCAELCVEALA